jgi:hypothetical protein
MLSLLLPFRVNYSRYCAKFSELHNNLTAYLKSFLLCGHISLFTASGNFRVVDRIDIRVLDNSRWAGIVQSVQRLATGWTVRDRIPVGARFSAPVQNGPGAHPASYTMGTGSFPGVSGWGVGLTTHPHLEPRLRKWLQLYFYSPSGPSWLVLR